MLFDTKIDDDALLPRQNRHILCVGLMIIVFLASCTTSNIDTALMPEPLPPAPQSAALATARQSDAMPSDPFTETQVAQDPASLDRDGFPNINAVPEGATTQITVAEKAQMQSQSQASANRISTITPAETAAYQARLKKLKLLAQQHAKNTQKEIEGN